MNYDDVKKKYGIGSYDSVRAKYGILTEEEKTQKELSNEISSFQKDWSNYFRNGGTFGTDEYRQLAQRSGLLKNRLYDLGEQYAGNQQAVNYFQQLSDVLKQMDEFEFEYDNVNRHNQYLGQYQKAQELLQGYADRVKNEEWLNSDDLTGYSNAFADYVAAGDKLFTSMFGYADSDIQGFQDSKAPLEKMINEIIAYYDPYKNDEIGYNASKAPVLHNHEIGMKEALAYNEEEAQKKLDQMLADTTASNQAKSQLESLERYLVYTDGRDIDWEATVEKYPYAGIEMDPERGFSGQSAHQLKNSYYKHLENLYAGNTDDYLRAVKEHEYRVWVKRDYEYLNLMHQPDFNTVVAAEKEKDADIDGRRTNELYSYEEDIYYYIRATQGEDAADQYISHMKNTLKERRGWATKRWIASRYFNGAAATLYGFGTGIAGATRALVAEPFTNLDPAVFDYANEGLQEGSYLSETQKKFHQGGLIIGQQMPAMAATAITKSRAVGKAVSTATAYGLAEQQGRRMGMTDRQAREYAVLSAAGELALGAASDKLFGVAGLDDFGKIGAKIDLMKSVWGRVALKSSLRIAGELVEEIPMDFLEPWFISLITEEEYKAPEWEDVLETAIMTFFTTGAMSVPGISIREGKQQNAYRKIGQDIRKGDGVFDLKGKAFDADKATAKFARWNVLESEAGKKNDAAIGQLYTRLSKAEAIKNASADRVDISHRLQEAGYSPDQAKAIADALVAQNTGQDLTRAQEKALRQVKGDKKVEDVVSDLWGMGMANVGQDTSVSDIYRSAKLTNAISEITKGKTDADGKLTVDGYKALLEAAGIKAMDNDLAEDVDTVAAESGTEAAPAAVKATAPASDGQVTGKLEYDTDVDLEGKTFVKSTGDVAETVAVKEIGKGGVTLTVNGKTDAAMDDVSFGDAKTNEAFHFVTGIEGMTAEVANKILNHPDLGKENFARDAVRAFRAGVRNDRLVLGRLDPDVISKTDAESFFQKGREAVRDAKNAENKAVKSKATKTNSKENPQNSATPKTETTKTVSATNSTSKRSDAEKLATRKKQFEGEKRRVSYMSPEKQKYLAEKYAEYKGVLDQLEEGDNLVDDSGNVIGTVVGVYPEGISIIGEDGFIELIPNGTFAEDSVISFLETGDGHFEKADGTRITDKPALVASVKTANKTGKVYYGYDGKTIDEREGDLTKKQKADVNFTKRVAKMWGATYYFFESYQDENGNLVYKDKNGKIRPAKKGFYDPSDGSIHIDLNRDNMLFTIAHELVHFIRDWSPVRFKQMADLVMEDFNRQNISAEELVMMKQAEYKEDGIELTEEQAFEEVIAASLEEILVDGRVYELMQKIEAADKGLGAKIKKFFQDIANLIRDTIDSYKNVRSDSPEASIIRKMEDIYQKLQVAFAKGAMDAGTNFQKAENTTMEGGVRYAIAGTESKTANIQSLMDAKKQRKDGVDPETIRKETGWFQGYDGMWRYEISDKDMEIDTHGRFHTNPDIRRYTELVNKIYFGDGTATNAEVQKLQTLKQNLKGVNMEPDTLGKLVKHDALFFAYPQLKNIPVKFADISERGKYSPATKTITIRNDLKADKSQLAKTLVHEIQHAIQDIEGFTGGASIEYWRNMGIPENKLAEYYEKTAGEIEARDVVARKDLSDEAIKQNRPDIDRTDVVLSDTIDDTEVRYMEKDESKRIKEQISSVAEKLNKMDVVSSVKTNGFSGMQKSDIAKEIEKEYAKFGKKVDRQNFGIILLEYKQINKALNYLYTDAEKAALLTVPKVLKRGIIADFHTAHKARGVDSYTFAAPVEINGKRGNVGVVVQRETGTNRFKTLRILLPNGKAFEFVKNNEADSTAGSSSKQNSSEGIPIESASETSIDNSAENVKNNFDVRYSVGRKTDQAVQEMLEKENADLREDVAKLKELLKLQGQETGGTKFTASSVLAAARYIKKLSGSKANTNELSGMLNDFYEYIATNEELTWEDVREQAQPIAQWLMDRVEHTRSDYAQEVLDQMKGGKVYLDETQMKEAEYLFGSYNDFRRSLGGAITVARNSSMSLDVWWQEMSTLYPDVFAVDVTASDMVRQLSDIVNSLRNENSSALEYAYNRRWIEQDLIRDIYDSFWRVSNLRTVADRYAAKHNKLVIEHNERINRLKTENREKIEQLKEQHRAEVEMIRNAYRQKLDDQRKDLNQKYQQSREKAVEGRRKTEMRRKIRKTIRDLDKILNRGDKKRNVKEDMKDFVASAIASSEILFIDNLANEDLIRNGIGTDIDERESMLLNSAIDIMAQMNDLQGYDNMEQRDKLDRKLKMIIHDLQPVFARERARLNKATVESVLSNLAEEYAKLKNSEHDYVKGAYHENVYNYIKLIQEDIGGTKIKDMSLSQLNKLYKAYTMVMTTVRDANKAFVMSKSVDQIVEKLVTEFGGRKMPKKKIGAIARNLANMTGWNYEKLYYALDRIGSETLTELFNNLANSENIVMADVIEAKQAQAAIAEKYGYNNWKVDKEIDKDFVDNTGKVFRLTLGEMMSLYAYSRREGAWKHIEYGGFVFGETALTEIDPVAAYKLTKDQCEAITNHLTEDQKKFAEEMQTFLSDVMGAKGNEVSVLLYGIEMFGEKNYFPIHIAGQFKANAQESQAKAEAGFSSMTNAGFTQAQNKEAKAPFVMESFMDVWTDHVNEMSRYHGTVPALEDIRKVMNYSVYSDADKDSVSVKAIMENKFGKQAVDYFDNLYREANSGAITDKLQKTSHKMLSRFRKNSVAYSLSVLVQQPLSMIRAFALIDKKYFSGPRGWGALPIGLTKTVFNRWTKVQDKAYAEMLKYAPGVTLAKEIGGFDTASGNSIRSYLLDTDKGFVQKMKTDTLGGKAKAVMNLVDDNPIANLPNVADKIAWIEIWNACKRETASKHPDIATSSDAFMDIVGKRFTEIIRATQVYDSIFAKSPMLKSKNLVVQYLVSFMNETNTIANMVESGARDLTNGDFRNATRKITAVIRCVVMTSVIKSIIYAMRDDDEDETYIEKYTEALTSNLLSDITVFNYIPIARDAWSIAQGYDVERPDMAIVSDAISSLTKVLSNMGKDTSDMTEEEMEEWDKKVTAANWKLVDSVAAFFGIPVKNIRREINAVMDHARIANENSGKTTWNSIEDAVERGIADASPVFAKPETETKTDKLYDAIIDGDKEYVDRMKGGYKDTNAYNNAVKKALMENDPRIKEAAQAQVDGDPSERIRIARLIIADGFPQDAVVMAINAEINALTPDDDSAPAKKVKGDYTVADFAREFANGDHASIKVAREDIIETAQENGKSQKEAEEDFASDARSEFRDLFVAGELTESEAREALKTYCPAKDGPLDDNDIYWIIREWEYEKANGSSDGYRKYNDFYGAVETGRDLGAVISEYTSHGVKKDTLASEITSHFKPLYREMSSSKRATFKKYLLNAYAQLGYDRSKKSKDIDKWLED